MNKVKLASELGATIVWFCVGWVLVEMFDKFTSIDRGLIVAFFTGALVMFIGLTLLGHWKFRKMDMERREAMDQFIKDQEADNKKQAKIDKEVIEQLRNEHQLSGSEQDQRLKALEAALKHLRGK